MKTINLFRLFKLLFGLLFVAVCLLGGSEVAKAGGIVFRVDRTDDVNPPATLCEDGIANDCSLRGAIIAANAASGLDFIELLCNSYELAIALSGANDAASGDLNITGDVSFTVKGSLTCIIAKHATVRGAAGFADRIFRIENGAHVTMSGLNIRNGDVIGTLGNGGGIHVAANSMLTLTHSNVISHSAMNGGGIFNLGTLALQASSVFSNTANQGGGIYNSGALMLVNSTLSGNSASERGGGIYHLEGSTHAGNATISNNSGEGGGIYNAGAAAEVQISNTLLHKNYLSDVKDSNCRGKLTSGGYNIVTTMTGCFISAQSGDRFDSGGADLAALTLQVGGSWMHPLQRDSRAIEGGNPAGCVDAQGALLLNDQRGVKRPQGSRCDVGSYEWNGPHIDAISPTTMTVGGPDINLIVTGFNFVDGAVVNFSGEAQQTTFVSSTQLSAVIPAKWFKGDGNFAVRVAHPDYALSNLKFFRTSPGAVLNSIVPASAIVDGAAFSLTVYGEHFLESAVVRWNGNPRTTTFVSSTQLVAQIDAGDLAAEGTAQVSVLNIAPNGLTQEAPFVIQPPGSNPVPTLIKLWPEQVAQGSAGFTLLIDGANFISGTMVDWGGNLHTPSFITSNQLGVLLTAGDLAQLGAVKVSAINPEPGGGKSNEVTFTVDSLQPTLMNMTPAAVPLGSGVTTIELTGANFTNNLLVSFHGVDLPTVVIDSNHIKVEIPALLLQDPGWKSVKVRDPNNVSQSNWLYFIVIDPEKEAQTIDFAPLADQSLLAGTVVLSATASSKLPIIFMSRTPLVCSALNNTVRLLSHGVCSIAAIQAGNYQYNPAPDDVVRSFTITLPSQSTQSITFPELPDRPLSEGGFALSASASSGLPITVASATPAVCTVSVNNANVNNVSVTLHAVGECILTATQLGNINYDAAAPVQRKFQVLPTGSPPGGSNKSVYLPLVQR